MAMMSSGDDQWAHCVNGVTEVPKTVLGLFPSGKLMMLGKEFGMEDELPV